MRTQPDSSTTDTAKRKAKHVANVASTMAQDVAQEAKAHGSRGSTVTVKKLVGNLAKDAIVTTASAARHPIGSVVRAAGLVKGIAGAGPGLMREMVRGPGETGQSSDVMPEQTAAESSAHESSATEASESSAPESSESSQSEACESSASDEPAGATTHRTPPGPDIVPKPVQTLDELPEPIVISAED